MRRLIFIAAFALIAAACGSGESAVTFESPVDSGGTSNTTTTTPVFDEADDPPNDSTTTVAPTAPTDLADSDYPDVVVADLAGGEVNLKELVLEDEPVLLWFWAPH
ncbi:MAG: hypothetical protein KJO87_08105 [Acidimicrobiia bacterium]|nr:hypothetical protein [Acidimicrobiia bacterium]